MDGTSVTQTPKTPFFANFLRHPWGKGQRGTGASGLANVYGGCTNYQNKMFSSHRLQASKPEKPNNRFRRLSAGPSNGGTGP